MSRFLLTAFAGLATLVLTSPAHAGGRGYSGSVSHVSHNYSTTHNVSTFRTFSTPHSFVQKYGTKFSHGYYFSSKNFYYNTRRWSSRYGCYCYWCPYVNSWYYWSPAQTCYYPLSYITVAPPTVVVAPATVTVAAPVSGGPDGPIGPGGPGGSMPPAGPPVP